MRKSVFAAVLMGLTLTACNENKQTTNEDMNTTLQLTQEWDKTFPKSDKVTVMLLSPALRNVRSSLSDRP